MNRISIPSPGTNAASAAPDRITLATAADTCRRSTAAMTSSTTGAVTA